eukprot:gene6087-792_t
MIAAASQQQFEAYFQAELKKHLEGGEDPSTFILDQRLTTLRPRNHEWTVEWLRIDSCHASKGVNGGPDGIAAEKFT